MHLEFNSNIINVTNVDTPTLSYVSTKLNTLLINYPGLSVIVNQVYNSNIYYYALQNEYLIEDTYNDSINNSNMNNINKLTKQNSTSLVKYHIRLGDRVHFIILCVFYFLYILR